MQRDGKTIGVKRLLTPEQVILVQKILDGVDDSDDEIDYPITNFKK